MVIWYACKYASPEKYYFGTRHFYLSEEWVNAGNEVVIFTSNATHLSDALPRFKGKQFIEDINGVRTVWLNTWRSKKSGGLSRVISWFHFEWQLSTTSKGSLPRPDVVIASSLSLLTVWTAFWMARRYNAKLIFEVRDVWPLSAIVLGRISPRHPFMRFLAKIERLGYTKSNAIVATIPNLEPHVKRISAKHAPVYCIPQGVSEAFYQKNGEPLSDAFLQQMPQGFVICYAGTINVNNPLDTLLEAARLLKDRSGIHFVIVGNGDRKAALAESAKDLPNVRFLGPVRKNQVNRLLGMVSVCYDSFTSELAEFGLSRNKWVDYMYAAKPVICSFNGFQSMLNEANAGSFVPFGDAAALAREITRYAALPEAELKQMGENGRKFLLENRTFRKLAAQYLEIIKQS